MRTRGSNYDTPLDTPYGNSPTTEIRRDNLTYHAKQLSKGLLVFGAGLLGYAGFSVFFGNRREANTLKTGKVVDVGSNLAFPEENLLNVQTTTSRISPSLEHRVSDD